MGGNKTVGMIFSEAVALLQAKYWQTVGVASAQSIARLVLSVLMVVPIMLMDLLIIIPAMFLVPVSAGLAYQHDNPVDALPVVLGLLGVIALLCLLFSVVLFLFSAILSVVEQTVGVGVNEAMLRTLDGGKPTLDSSWQSFKRNFKRYLGISAWSTLWTFLWSLLLYVPGIIKSCGYALAPFLVIEYPEMSVRDALKKSSEMTQGYKGRIFVILLMMLGFTWAAAMFLSFVPFAVTAALLFWIFPLYYSMLAIAYRDIKLAAVGKGLLH